MRKLILLFVLLQLACGAPEKTRTFSAVDIETIYEDSLSIRAIEFLNDGSLAFAANRGMFGLVNLNNNRVKTNVMKYDTIVPEFRAVAHTDTDFFMLSVANPALLYKTGSKGAMELVYQESDTEVFYDAITFWNNDEGIAIGDAVKGCLSILITRNGGRSWKKVACEAIPIPKDSTGEGAFAASNTNIVVHGNLTWVATTSGDVLYSSDKGRSWERIATPIRNAKETEGIYSMAFYNEKIGYAIGGDYTAPENTQANKAKTTDGGKSWKLVADGVAPGYKSCVQFVPNAKGNGLVAVGFTGISYSSDGGSTWRKLSKESFYTLRFLNDSIGYAAGRNRIAKLKFR